MPTPPLGFTTRCRIVEVIDGDTLEVEVTKRVRVRLLDCWAPESRTLDLAEKKKGLIAKGHLRQIAEGQPGVLYIAGHETCELGDSLTLGRVLGQIWVDGPDKRSLAEIQVANKFAATRKGAPLGK
jgi:endonuclease YncB( thermonuclease family)